MMIALPNIDGSFTVTLFFANEGKESFESLTSDKVIKEFFDRNFKDVTNVMPDFLNIYKSNPVGSLATITSDLWHIEDKVLILGDASHGIVPFYGQGMNAGFEDCSVLYNIITNSENKDDWETIFKKLQESRKPNTDAIAQLSLDNFIEMRDSMSNALGLLRKKAETMLYDKYPDEIISKYSMVSFHPEISYKKAYEKGKILENTFADLIRSENDDIDLELAYKTIIEQFERLILEID